MHKSLSRVSLALVMGLSSFVLVIPTTEAAANIAGNGRIVFSSAVQGDANSEIYSINADGSNQVNLSNNSASDDEPNVSADGTKIVFTSKRSSAGDIYKMNMDGTGVVKLTDDANVELNPRWSPDGTKIAYGRSISGKYHTYVMNADGSNSNNITGSIPSTASYEFQGWLPSGAGVYFTRRDTADAANDGIYVMTPSGTTVTKVTTTLPADIWPSISPLGNDLLVYNPSTGLNIAPLTGTRSTLGGIIQNPAAFSPDGTKLLFARLVSGQGYKLFISDLDGNNAKRLTTAGSTINEGGPSWQKVMVSGSSTEGDKTTTTIANGDSLPTQNYSVISNETLVVNGTLGAVGVNAGGVLKGTDTVGNVSLLGGTVAPGLSPGALNTGNFTATGGTYEVEIGGTAAGQFDQLNVTGTVDLGSNTTLSTVLFGGFTPAVGNTFTIINNDGADAVTGTFQGMAQGASFTQNNVTYTISYTAGTGNDVVITATAVGVAETPAPTAPATGFGLISSNPITTLLLTVFAALGSAVLARRYRQMTQ